MSHHESPDVQLVRDGLRAVQNGDMTWLEEHLSDDVVWHVGGNSKWAGTYRGKRDVLDFQGRQGRAMSAPPSVDVHDILGSDDHVVVIGSASATAADGSSAAWKFVNVFHIADGKATEVWGMADNDAAVDPFLDALPDE